MAEPIIAQKGAYPTDVESGKTYYWCSCGHSNKHPFCDGSHKEFGMAPLPVEVNETKKMYFCGCKQSAKKPFCDGTHSSL